MEADDELVFVFREVASLEIRAEIVDPAKPAALAAAEQSSSFRERPPATFTVELDVADEALVFLFGPCSFVCVLFLTTGRPPHLVSFPSFFFLLLLILFARGSRMSIYMYVYEFI